MAKLLDLNIEFPEIGDSKDTERQIAYATDLREKYVTENKERFKQIAENAEYLASVQLRDGIDEDDIEYEQYTEEEAACLLGVSARGIIMSLKDCNN